MRQRGTTPRSRGSSRGGKCGGRAGKQCVLTWGDPAWATGRGVSKGRSSEEVRESGWSEGPNRTGVPTCARYGLFFTTGRKPVSDRNRRMPSGTCGGVGLVAG